MEEKIPNAAAEYVDTISKLVDLSIDSEYRPSVIQNFERIMTIAKLVTEFPLPEDLEIAPIFEP
ncbi:DUF4089 domain-containing protein [[Phormidium ambiguum] IAM M-71]|uniref:DUF4089 domain-containing protein n=1 Tax=[Phormidium ambiguum] IAM M-71 TaxID=454136 RepID=A0A1U7IME9_9CYAN|nr:DUF4089 domain-containing protein [Phormidium ambiguum]OKH38452.1 DUF4089 domain-containing protein [Phormidium ambiguum IAM M-71]